MKMRIIKERKERIFLEAPGDDGDVVLWDALPKNVKIIFSTRSSGWVPKLDNFPVGVCSQGQCAQFVSDMLNQWQGDAWRAHRGAGLKSIWNQKAKAHGKDLADLFTILNLKGGLDGSDEELELVKKVIRKMVPEKAPWGGLKLGDVVGLWFDPSDWTAKVFWAGARGYDVSGNKLGGPYFITKEGKPWDETMLKKQIRFYPGRTINSGKIFGMNTHIGFVGGLRDNEPIVFHNIHGAVFATPLSKMRKDSNMMVFSKPGPR
jgi:hypothetical protein